MELEALAGAAHILINQVVMYHECTCDVDLSRLVEKRGDLPASYHESSVTELELEEGDARLEVAWKSKALNKSTHSLVSLLEINVMEW